MKLHSRKILALHHLLLDTGKVFLSRDIEVRMISKPKRWSFMRFFIRLKSWEYWPFHLFYFPIFLYWIILSIKSRSILYFTASNPGIQNGGFLGESKQAIQRIIPGNYLPGTLHFTPQTTVHDIVVRMEKNFIQFPVIAKPDMGERGYLVRKIYSGDELHSYLNDCQQPFLIQEFVDMPFEAGVFFYRFPDNEKGIVSSIVLKEMLVVKGNGTSTLAELIRCQDRAVLQENVLYPKFSHIWNDTIDEGVEITLNSLGNHCLGTKFLDGNRLINDELHEIFSDLAAQIDGFYYGRFDIRAENEVAFLRGDFKILELNGSGAEPAHIYQPGTPLFKAYKVLFHHWKVLFRISKANHTLGIPYLSLVEGVREYRRIKKIKRNSAG